MYSEGKIEGDIGTEHSSHSLGELALWEAKPRQNTTRTDFYPKRSAISCRVTYQLPPPDSLEENELENIKD